jgi:hypothetical protein
MKKLILTSALLFVSSGCAMKQKVMDVSIVSMSRANLPVGATLAEKGEVSGKFCADQWHDKGSIGLFDEAIKRAQKSGHVDFISNASFYREGNCVTVEGTGQKIVLATVPAAISVPGAASVPKVSNPKVSDPKASE